MRIAILVTLFPPKWLAGTEIATYNIAEQLAKRGHEVHVITSLDEGLPKASYEKGFHIHRLPRIGIRFMGGLIFWADIIRELRKIKPDIVHAQSFTCGMPALLSNKLLRIPYVIYGRGSDVYLPSWLTKLTSKIIQKNASASIALTEHMKGVMQTGFKKDVIVIPNGINPAEGVVGESVGRKHSKRILFVGRLHPVKGTRYLLGAMSIVRRDMPEAKLVLVGDGGEREHLENLTDDLKIRECVEFIGRVPHENVQNYMNQSDVFVLPSLSEGFPVTILEAMACGLPVVATRVGGIPDIVEDGINGYLVDAMDQEMIAEALLKLLKDEELWEEVSNNNREKSKKYRWDTVAAALEEMYQTSIRSSKYTQSHSDAYQT